MTFECLTCELQFLTCYKVAIYGPTFASFGLINLNPEHMQIRSSTITRFCYVACYTFIALFAYLKKACLAIFKQFCFIM